MNSIYSYWNFDPGIMALLAGISFGYLFIIGFRFRKQSLYFFAGILLIFFCETSPLHFLGENYLFSAHMLVHVLILLIAAPLLVAGIPAENRLKRQFLNLSATLFKNPYLAWIVGVGIMWFWHIPYIFNQLFSMQPMGGAHSMNGLMYIHLLSILNAGIIFCWPILNPYQEFRMAAPKGVLYLSSACVFCTILGLMITFASVGLYSHYINGMDSYGYLPTIRNGWKITPEVDQQMAGLIMWVPCCMLYLSASMLLLINWFKAGSRREVGLGSRL